jgi:hypothetical protein
MAHFFRLIAFLCLFSASSAFAAVSGWNGSADNSVLYPSPQAAIGSKYGAGTSEIALIFQTATDYQAWWGSPSYTWKESSKFVTSGSSCGAGSVDVGGVCSCPGGLDASGLTCAPPVDPQQELCNALKGTEVYGSIPGNHSPGSTSCNVLGCSATLAGTVLRVKDASGQYVTEGALTFTDQVCTYSAESGSVEDSCPGGASGELNGVTVCVPYDPNMNTIESVKATTSTTANGSGTSSTVTTTNTTCTNGSCNTTSTTVVNVNGTPSSETKNTQEPQTDFCAKNPNDPQCSNKGSFSGACSAGFTCSGDAVQCAIARELHSQNCKLNAISTESAIYDASKGKTGNQTTDLPGNEAHTFGPASFDQTDALGGGSCISDLSIEVLGNTVTLPTSNVCPYLLWLRSALLAIGAILWIVIVFRS